MAEDFFGGFENYFNSHFTSQMTQRHLWEVLKNLQSDCRTAY